MLYYENHSIILGIEFGKEVWTNIISLDINREAIVNENIVEDVAKLIVELADIGKIGSGKIFILPVEDAIRIRDKNDFISNPYNYSSNSRCMDLDNILLF